MARTLEAGAGTTCRGRWQRRLVPLSPYCAIPGYGLPTSNLIARTIAAPAWPRYTNTHVAGLDDTMAGESRSSGDTKGKR